MARNHRKSRKLSTGALVGIFGLLFLVVGGFALAYQQGWLAPENASDDSEPANSYTLIILDARDSEVLSLHVTYTWYYCNATNLTSIQVKGLTFSDFTAMVDDENVIPKPNFIYVCNISYADYVSTFVCTDPNVANGEMQTIILGSNTVYLMNQSEDVSILCYTMNSFTVNQTDYTDWTIVCNSLDASESTTAELTSEEGYKSFYDFENGTTNSFVLRVEFNTTAVETFCELVTSYEFDEEINGNYVYYEIFGSFYGSVSFDLFIDDALGTDFEVIGIACGIGNENAFTALDTQN